MKSSSKSQVKREFDESPAPEPTNSADRKIEGKKPASRSKSILPNLLLLFFSVLLMLVALEVGVRIIEAQRGESFLANPQPTWSDRPKYYYRPHHSNTFHDYRYEVPKPEGIFRIATVGDSFTYTPYMQFDDNYPKRLERMLQLASPRNTNNNVEVISYGVWSLSTMQEIPYLKRALASGADLAILQITLNDAEIASFGELWKKKKPITSFWDLFKKNNDDYVFGPLEISKEASPLLYHWRSLLFVASRINVYRTQASHIKYHLDMFENPTSWGNFAYAVKQMKALCDEKGVPFVAVIFPYFSHSMDEKYPFKPIHDKVNALFQSLDIPLLDLFPAFRDIPVIRLQVIPGVDSHPNEVAHRIAAEEMYAWLESLNLIPEEHVVRDKYIRRTSISDNRVESVFPTTQ